MCFFRYLVLILLIIISSFMFYQYLSQDKRIIISKKSLILGYLILVNSLFMLFTDHSIFFIFLDFSCFLGYSIKKRKEAFLISLINTIFCINVLDVPKTFYLIYIAYFVLDYVLTNHRKNTLNYFLFLKAFITSFTYFLYYNHSVSGIIYLIFIFLYFYILLELVSYLLKKYEDKTNDDTIIFQIAHEVKNPIAVCKGYLDMIDTNKKKINKYLPIIRSEMNRALAIMDDFLNLKRINLEKDIMDLYMLMEDVDETMKYILNNQNVSLKIDSPEDEIFIEGDYDRLKQVFINLIKNSYEADAKNIKIDLKIEKTKIKVSIIDDGSGICNKDMNKIGEVFYTTKKNGTGIGVSMAREIIKMHRGKIEYKSTFGKGTAVIITLPSKYA